jgi:signal transduction histidine kinase/ActR/RegA family two-component response regulator
VTSETLDPTTITSGSRLTTMPVSGTARAYLVVLAGGQPGRRYEIGERLVVGRSAAVGMQVDDPEVSRRHLVVRRDTVGHVVEDLGSRNRTLLNGSPVEHARALAFGDKLQLGASVVLLFMAEGAERELLRRERLETLGRISAGVAHDINNMLATMLASLDYLDDALATAAERDAGVRECLEDVRTAVTQATALTPRLLDFSRERHEQDVDIGGLCREVVHLAQRTFERTIEVEADLADDLTVRGDRVGLHQMLMNLCLNARDAMPNGGRLLVRTRATLSEDDDQSAVEILVSDTGAGLDREARRQIFVPFFTTKARQGGTGLGLATVREVVIAHGGTIEVDGARGRGTTFTVRMPALRASAGALRLPTTNQRLAPATPRTGSILVIDDEHTVRRAFARILRSAGHEVVLAADGASALELYTHAPRRPDLVLLDFDMPGLRGDEVQRRLRRIDPTVRVLFVSGHACADVERRVRADGALAFVHKPVPAPALLDAVAEALARPPTSAPAK